MSTPENQQDQWDDDNLVEIVRIRPPKYRKAFVMALRARGMITDEETAFLFYVFSLKAK